MRKFVIALLLLLGVVFVLTRIAEVQTIYETLQQGNWRYILLAFAVEMLWVVNIGVCFRSIYKSLGMEERFDRLAMLALAANFVNIVAPSGGMGGVAVFITEAKRRRNSIARATLAGALFIIFEYTSFACVLVMGLFVLFRRNHLSTSEVVASAVVLSVTLTLAFLLYLGMQSGERLGHILVRLARFLNRILHPFMHREYLSEERAFAFAIDASNGLQEIRAKPLYLVEIFLLALLAKVWLISVFALVFLAFNVPLSPGTLVAGFTVSYLFWVVSPTPSGVGIVEGVLAISLSTLGVPLAAATVIALAYRGITFWFPTLLGMLSFRWLGRQPGAELST